MALAGLIQQVLEKKEGLTQNMDEDERRTLKQEEDTSFIAAGMAAGGAGRDREKIFAGQS